MFQRIRLLIRIMMGGALGCFVSHALYVLWHYQRHPALYAIQSAPWYTSILLSLGLTGVFCVMMILMDGGLGLCIQARERKVDSHGKT